MILNIKSFLFILINLLTHICIHSINPLNGPFSTSGNQIINTLGQNVRLKGVSWFGFETNTLCPHGLWSRNYKNMMDQIKSLGFNLIRIPYCNQMFDSNSKPNSIDYNLNTDLNGLNCIQILDKIISYADQIGIYIILDHHRSNIGAGPNENGLWYTSEYTETRFIEDWQMLAKRYFNNESVIGADIHNEPKGPATWGDGNISTDWQIAAEKTGNAIHSVNSKLLIIIEGVEFYNNNGYWWGGNLMAVKTKPVKLNINNKIVYCPHDYPNSVWPESWFNDSNFPNNLPALFTKMWGFIFQDNIAPIIIGEFGSRLQDPKDILWLTKLMNYMNGDFTGNGSCTISNQNQGMSWIWWCFNPNSSDTGGILKDDWKTIHQNKIDTIASIMKLNPCIASTSTPTNYELIATYKVEKDWQTGYQVTINLKNILNSDTKNWKVEFDLKGNEIIESICGANYTITNKHFVVTNPLWQNGNIIKVGQILPIAIVFKNAIVEPRALLNLKAIGNY